MNGYMGAISLWGISIIEMLRRCFFIGKKKDEGDVYYIMLQNITKHEELEGNVVISTLAHNGQGLRAVIFIVLRNLQGIILSKALKIQKDPEEIGAQMNFEIEKAKREIFEDNNAKLQRSIDSAGGKRLPNECKEALTLIDT
ncbi:hypothetical protein ACJX0J_025122, partial [Zea mays]